MMDDLFAGMDTGKARRDEGIHKVTQNNLSWMENGIHCVEYFIAPGREVTAEDLRACVSDPRHGNAWGALTRAAVRQGLLEPTGRYTKARLPSNHAREIKIYRRTNKAAR
jgi:hypothetical protein